MTLPEQVCDPLLGPNPPVENHCNNEYSIESSMIETYLVTLYLSLYFLQIDFRKFIFFRYFAWLLSVLWFFGRLEIPYCDICSSHRTMSDQSRCLAAWTAHTLMGRTGMLLWGPDWWAFLLLAENQAPSQQRILPHALNMKPLDSAQSQTHVARLEYKCSERVLVDKEHLADSPRLLEVFPGDWLIVLNAFNDCEHRPC